MSETLTFKKNDIILRAQENCHDLYFLQKGKVLVCVLHETEVKVLDRIDEGEFLGELSFFDNGPRSSHVVALEECTLIKMKREELTELLPYWFLEVGKSLSKKIRLLDKVIETSRIKKVSFEDQLPLSAEEQKIIRQALRNGTS